MPTNNMEILTIGYSSFALSDFIDILKENEIKCLIDVRSQPYSQYRAEYNKEELEKQLQENGILYRNYFKEFGARQENIKFYGSDNVLDFDEFIKSEQFQSGIEKIRKGITGGYSFALMCAEKDPINCHRAIMVGKGFKNAGFSVKHIIDKKTTETQEQLENRLLDIYFKDRNQLSLFADEIECEDELIKKAYILRNKEIGYKLDSKNEEDEE